MTVIKEVWGKGNVLLKLSPPLPSCFSFRVPLTAGSLGVKQAPCLSNMIPTSSQLPRAREPTYVSSLPPSCAPWSCILVQPSLAGITAASPTAGLLCPSSSTPRNSEQLACKPDLSVHLTNPPRAPIVPRVKSKCFNVPFMPSHD